jgi:hypothetical protein
LRLSGFRKIAGYSWRIRFWALKLRSALYRAKVYIRWIAKGARPANKVSIDLIVSLTSYPPRYAALALTLRCLLTQSLVPDRVILWVTPDDLPLLPDNVRQLTAHGLEIFPCDELGSYKKIIPALVRFPKAAIVTADDDLYYASDWLAQLVAEWEKRPQVIACHRAHHIHRTAAGLFHPYGQWEHNIAGCDAGPNIFPTSGGGALYPPGSLHEDVARAELFLKLCPNADDVWLYWMARRAGWAGCKFGPPHRLIEWNVASPSALWLENLNQGGNDRKIAAVRATIGPPELDLTSGT